MFETAHFFAPLAEPMAMIWCLMLVAAMLFLRKKRWSCVIVQLMLAGLVYVFGATPFPSRLLARLEQPYARKDPADVPACDAVVLLGGTHRPSQFDIFGVDLAAAADRIITAAELMREHKGRALVLGGGGYKVDGQEKAEGPLLEKWFAAWQLPVSPVFNLGVNADTHDEATHFQSLAKQQGWKKVILVTSAFHMKRAEATFKKVGISVVPVACDFQCVGVGSPNQQFRVFPRRDGFEAMELYLHEAVGWYVYSWRGWLEAGDAPPAQDKPRSEGARQPPVVSRIASALSRSGGLRLTPGSPFIIE